MEILNGAGVAQRRLLEAGFFAVVGVADRVPQLAVELGAVQYDLLGMHRIDGAERDGEVARILDVDDQLGASAGRDLTNGAELLAAVGNICLESNLNFFLHELFLHGPSGAMLQVLQQVSAETCGGSSYLP
jgi:hypothetical protein